MKSLVSTQNLQRTIYSPLPATGNNSNHYSITKAPTIIQWGLLSPELTEGGSSVQHIGKEEQVEENIVAGDFILFIEYQQVVIFVDRLAHLYLC